MRRVFYVCLATLAIASVGYSACSSDDDPAPGGAGGSAGASGSAGKGGAATDGGAGAGGATGGAGGGTVDGGAGGTVEGGAGAGGSVADGATGDGAVGACNNATDEPIANDPATMDKVEKCAMDNMGVPEPAVKNCIKTQTGMSDACVVCWDDSVNCTLQKCLMQCGTDSKSAECTACMNENCMPAYYTCSGLSE